MRYKLVKLAMHHLVSTLSASNHTFFSMSFSFPTGCHSIIGSHLLVVNLHGERKQRLKWQNSGLLEERNATDRDI